MNNPMVSIAVTTYNQEDYIAQTLESLLIQQTNFDFIIVIGEDCSNDNTPAIVQEFTTKNPTKIQLLNSEENHGSDLNLLRTVKACTGKYIAICDGDDYWIDSNKLQKQVDFLEKNTDYGMVGTLRKDFMQDKNSYTIEPSKSTNDYETFDFNDFLFKNRLTASTVLFRRDLMLDFLDFYKDQKDISFNDYNFFLFFAYQKKAAKLNSVSIVYRFLSESGSRSVDAKKIWSFKKRFYDAIKVYLDVFKVSVKTKNEVLYYRAIHNYLFASRSGDTNSCKEFLHIFKMNKDTFRHFLLKKGMKNNFWNRFAFFIEKVNLKFGGFLLKKG